MPTKRSVIQISRKQQAFIDTTTSGINEVLYGGAAGGGKSWCQLIDALLYAITYPGSRQLILRRTYPELEKSLIRVARELYPREIWKYSEVRHSGVFENGSIVDFGYCDATGDVYKYQSAEYDTIRYDELTHFTEWMYIYLLSRLRGANDFPKQIKSTTNPGGVGHSWVKARFIDTVAPGEVFDSGMGRRLFIKSLVWDNHFLLERDPGYVERLRNLPRRERRALLKGDWDIFEGQFFPEFDREVHVCRPFVIPPHWKIYRALDYGLDMLSCLWVAVDEQLRGWVYKMVHEPNLIISDAAKRIREVNGQDAVYLTLAPPDLWNRRQETGRSAADIFAENGVVLTKTSNDRVDGWLAVKEWLKPVTGEQGEPTAQLHIFEGCVDLIRCLPAVLADEKNPCDVATEPHELTHAPDALRAFCIYWTSGATPAPDAKRRRWTADMYEDYNNAGEADRALLRERWGNPY